MELYTVLSLIFILVIIFWRFRSTGGNYGEETVASILKKLPEDKYKVLNNITIRTEVGTSQIDHIVFSIYGIFVIETKDYLGYIYGSEETEYWTKSTKRRKYRFYNPILQNYGHIRALRGRLGRQYSNVPIYSIVAFSGRGDLRITAKNSHVVYFSDLKRTILNYKDVVIPDENVDRLFYRISIIECDSKSTQEEHIQYARSVKNQKFAKIQSGICPRCGGKIVPREGKYGRFYGCSNYPDCKFTYKP
ncbi:MAG: NERD domain-containing protein [Bacteroidales bacterium]|nr:NERD domain-containing protein [Bacteroidales bacterium]